MFLDYLSLVILLIGLTLAFYAFIYIHDLPYLIAKKRHHPHEEAIHVGCWLSLLTLHAMWPFIYLWALTHKKQPEGTAAQDTLNADQSKRIADLEARLQKLENTKLENTKSLTP